jgi:hypothetical protein
MAGTNGRQGRQSVVDEDGWEPMRPERPPLKLFLAGAAVALVLVPLTVFGLTYLLMSR